MVHNRHYISVQISDTPWQTVLGGTDTLYFLLSYHFGLLFVSSGFDCLIPGFMVIDLPPDIHNYGDSKNVSFVIEPFIKLLEHPKYAHIQVIFSGQLKEDFQTCHRITLEKEFLSQDYFDGNDQDRLDYDFKL
jgi:hypothetical protein